jgi:hypothetical protein
MTARRSPAQGLLRFPGRALDQIPRRALRNGCKQIDFARCPFDITSLKVADGRKASLANSGFGTVFGVVDGKPLPVADYAGFASFGLGYRRCPGERLTIQVFDDFLRKMWKGKIEFVKLYLPSPGRVPVADRRH